MWAMIDTVVRSDTREPTFVSWHRQFLVINFLSTVSCIETPKLKKRGQLQSTFYKNKFVRQIFSDGCATFLVILLPTLMARDKNVQDKWKAFKCATWTTPTYHLCFKITFGSCQCDQLVKLF